MCTAVYACINNNIIIIFVVDADFVVHTPLNIMVPVNDMGEQFCLSLSIVDDRIAEDSEQFAVYFENIPSEFAIAGANDTICITIQENNGMHNLLLILYNNCAI